MAEDPADTRRRVSNLVARILYEAVTLIASPGVPLPASARAELRDSLTADLPELIAGIAKLESLGATAPTHDLPRARSELGALLRTLEAWDLAGPVPEEMPEGISQLARALGVPPEQVERLFGAARPDA